MSLIKRLHAENALSRRKFELVPYGPVLRLRDVTHRPKPEPVVTPFRVRTRPANS